MQNSGAASASRRAAAAGAAAHRGGGSGAKKKGGKGGGSAPTSPAAADDASRMIILPFLFSLLLVSNGFLVSTSLQEPWYKPGCHKVGHTRKISIPECVEFHMTTNACRGFCESWAVPSSTEAAPTQPVTSVGQCCNIMETEPVDIRVLCSDGVRTFTFKSAVSCACYHCKKD